MFLACSSEIVWREMIASFEENRADQLLEASLMTRGLVFRACRDAKSQDVILLMCLKPYEAAQSHIDVPSNETDR